VDARTRWELAQVNIARPIEPLDSPLLVEFMAALAPINALADSAPGSFGGCRPMAATPLRYLFSGRPN